MASDGRVIIFDVEENGVSITIVAVYGPNKDSPEFFKEIRQRLRNGSENKMLIGDFNLTLDCEVDRLNTFSNNNRAKDEVIDIMDEFNLFELWRIRHGDKREYSWMKKGSYPVKASRIDFALISGGLDQKIEMIQYLPGTMTDHRALYVVVDCTAVQRGKGFWKLNTSLLRDQNYIECINKPIDKVLSESIETAPKVIWERLKREIKVTTLNYSKQLATEKKVVIAQLREKVDSYESALPLTREENALWENSKIELEEKMLERARGIIFRSKVRWYEEGERSSKYFYNLEKARYNKKTCFTLIDQDKIVTDPAKILELQCGFYRELYSCDEEVKFSLKN